MMVLRSPCLSVLGLKTSYNLKLYTASRAETKLKYNEEVYDGHIAMILRG